MHVQFKSFPAHASKYHYKYFQGSAQKLDPKFVLKKILGARLISKYDLFWQFPQRVLKKAFFLTLK